MKKIKLCLISLILACSMFLTGCGIIAAIPMVVILAIFSGTFEYDSVEDYGEKWDGREPDFIPDTVEGYNVNQYSYILYSYLDTCYEILLDVTVSEEQLSEILSKYGEGNESVTIKDAWYCEGYIEIVFEDEYQRYIRETGEEAVGWATIDKIIYNPATLNVIFVSLHAHDKGVHDLEKVEYFNRFSINPEEYVEHLPKGE